LSRRAEQSAPAPGKIATVALFRIAIEAQESPVLASAAKTAPNRDFVHPFDRKYGTDTSGYLGPEELVKGRANDAHNYGYSAIAPSVFREAIRRWRETLPAVSGRVEGYSFVDVGCGKGRPLLLAAECPFRKIIGVEIVDELASIAESNAVRWKRVTNSKAKIRVMRQDATTFRWPRAPLLVYLYNPFACSLVAEIAARLAGIVASGSGPVDVMYVNPTCADALSTQGKSAHLWTLRIAMDAADQQADPYGTTSDLVSAYRLK
jgi:SAM-dependent methyltransferase